MKVLKNIIVKPSEAIMMLAGVLMLASVAVIANSQSFSLWYVSKYLYVAGATLILFRK